MCGIVAYIGKKEAYPIIVKGLKRLEYRGYDSAGVALLNEGELNIYKKQGKVANLEEHAADKDRSGHAGIGHTRWATHGEAIERNAHPHSTDRVAVVHNGIIENYINI
ncbi:MAG: glutamine--fructose-6-phosphate aminotransferase, partial [Crocinitomicaceae bacterium]